MTPLNSLSVELENHRPSKRQALLFFFLSLLAAVGLILWTFVFNKGVLTVFGSAPFTIKAGSEVVICRSEFCSVKLTPQKYDVAISKKRYFDDTQTVQIKFRKETRIAASLKFVPVLREVGPVVLPTQTAPLRAPFLGMEKFENFPRGAAQTLFSSSGNFALLKLGKEFYLYDIQKRKTARVEITTEIMPAWAGDNLIYMEEQTLKKWRGGDGAGGDDRASQKESGSTSSGAGGEKIVSFARPLKEPVLIGGPAADKILIEERDLDSHVYYLVDLNKKSRNRIEGGGFSNAKLLTSGAVFETGDGIVFVNYEAALRLDLLEQMPLPAVDAQNILEQSDGSFIFVALSRLNKDNSKLGISISEALEQNKNEIFGADDAATGNSGGAREASNADKESNLAQTLFITEFNPATKVYRTIVSVPVKEGEIVARLTFDAIGGGKFNFEKGGKLFEILMRE